MTVRAVLFDLDDTLLDWYSAVHSAWEAVCGEIAPALGGDPMSLREAIRREASLFWRDEAAVEHLRTRPLESREAYVRLALLAEGLDESPARAIAERSLDEMRGRIALFHDALDTLDALRAAGLRLGLVTNGHAATQRHKIDRFAIEEHFDVIVVEGEFGKGKPHPEVFAHALAGVGAAPDETWMVGDNLLRRHRRREGGGHPRRLGSTASASNARRRRTLLPTARSPTSTSSSRPWGCRPELHRARVASGRRVSCVDCAA